MIGEWQKISHLYGKIINHAIGVCLFGICDRLHAFFYRRKAIKKMPTFKLEDVVCWGDDQGKILCSNCFKAEFPDYPSEWTPIFFENDVRQIP